LAHLGQSGNSVPHPHFRLSNKATFEGSEGIPYEFESFDYLGPEDASCVGRSNPQSGATRVSCGKQAA